NTETLLVARGPFPLPPKEQESFVDRQTSPKDVEQTFRSLALGPFALSNELYAMLKDKEILFAAEGSRAFRPPKGLGELPYEGCAIAILSDDLGAAGDAFIQESGKTALRVEEIEGHKAAVFQQRLEEDTWTAFVAFPKKNVVAVATDKEYLREVLVRMR